MTPLLIAKATVMLALALAVAAAMCRATAATRHAVLVAAQIAVLLLPLLVGVVPAVVVSEEVVPIPDGLKAAAPVALARSAEPVGLSLAGVWGLGVVLVVLWQLLAYTRSFAIVRRARRAWPIGPMSPIGPIGPIRLLLSDEISQPMTFGRHILLPRAATTWPGDRLNAVLLHERAHVTRRDTLLQAIGDLACAVYWFHPLAWLAARRARLERERACDDLVLASGVPAGDYATALIDVARSAVRLSAAGMAMAERSQLATRVHALLDAGVRRRTIRGARALTFVIALAIAPLLAALDTGSIARPRFGEPDLRGDAIASPQSERIGVAAVAPAAATGPDAALIAYLQRFTQHHPESAADLVSDRARWALGRVERGELIAPLITSLQDSDWRVRAYAAWTLGVAADRRATAPLVALLEDDVWRVRASAAAALRHVADPAAARAMKRALGDEAWQVRSQAVEYFAAIGADRALFETMLHDRHIAVRIAAEEAIR